MTSYEEPFDLVGEYVKSETEKLERYAAEIPGTEQDVRERIAQLTNDPEAYIAERASEGGPEAIEKLRIFMRAFGLDPDKYLPQ
jgi:hypothetical protein